MNIKGILAITDHTLLRPTSTWDEITEILDDAMSFKCASACIPASFVEEAVYHVDKKLAICTVIGFPNGYDTTEAKVFMAEDAVENGASEVDMVINLGWVKDGLFDCVEEEISMVRRAVQDGVLKVIIESSELTEKEIIRLCKIVTDSGADFIKTSTGFASGGATFDVVSLMKEHVGENVGIKASGGISSFADAAKFMELGATRLGTSRLVKRAKAGDFS
ncbi:MAG: deoxyribose-phosphate aldolase [Eubacteriales bacterium]|nr:deoxyribose-phosphate aldolase [Eubacteriales bacterium]MDD4323499.1 deoxyribose-phosphate aldolase [Eubacteriales bacterium]MDD4541173.1 deoxyribose-phosphate aldolase [Eubacteriales bacterium]